MSDAQWAHAFDPRQQPPRPPASALWAVIGLLIGGTAITLPMARRAGYEAGRSAALEAAPREEFARLSEEAAAARAELDSLVVNACRLLAASDTNRQDAEP